MSLGVGAIMSLLITLQKTRLANGWRTHMIFLETYIPALEFGSLSTSSPLGPAGATSLPNTQTTIRKSFLLKNGLAQKAMITSGQTEWCPGGDKTWQTS
ncbi:hypothetical protein EMPG_14926 [Blastomyces silverae]|uniref:Uncharacterized protein n=1 Tax=Blastomyces silverae TaxID=2060906 RepID=A0A0H1BF48_9EURO|nr:hypothetical protein EMPG_14926 [Blastomyces silverae]